MKRNDAERIFFIKKGKSVEAWFHIQKSFQNSSFHQFRGRGALTSQGKLEKTLSL